jgi:dolichyl-diphosphooligosaccharide--protein glycosyltransferase
VLSWWDQGYWITRLAHRIPIANPAQVGVDTAAAFLLAREPNDGSAIAAGARARYMIVSSELAVDYGQGWKLPAVAAWAGIALAELTEKCRVRQPDGSWIAFPVFYPAFYKSMAVRLWTFGGQAIVPRNATWLVTTARHTDTDGTELCEITGMGRFATYDDAQRALATEEYRAGRIVGLLPTESPIPLEALSAFREVYRSPEQVVTPGAGATLPALRIFESQAGLAGRDVDARCDSPVLPASVNASCAAH